jgi:ERCC4-type nuclease
VFGHRDPGGTQDGLAWHSLCSLPFPVADLLSRSVIDDDLFACGPAESEGSVRIVADLRERASGVVGHLERLGSVRVEVKHLTVADFLLGGGVAVERKTARDFVASILDRRLFDQAQQLVDSYERPLLVLEGDPLTAETGVHPNAIRGALAHVAVARRLPILPSAGPLETAELLAVIARRMQRIDREGPRGPAKRRAGTVAQHQEAVAASLPGVGAVLARRLLQHSGSLAALARADTRTLRQVPGIGRQRAQSLTTLLVAPYRPEDGAHPPAETKSDTAAPPADAS